MGSAVLGKPDKCTCPNLVITLTIRLAHAVRISFGPILHVDIALELTYAYS